MKKLSVAELFAGVGGFRLGLEKSEFFEVKWSNQWEPSTKRQHASEVYVKNFGDYNHSNEDINSVPINEIPDCDVLVGGFPCQDYSVANSLKRSGGIEGKKGVLWWSIDNILRKKKSKPKYLILENVDRLLKSPVKQRGRDFAIMLKCLQESGYAVEWRVINAADFGFPQRRRRIFIIGYHETTEEFKSIKNDSFNWITEDGILANAFPIQGANSSYQVSNNLNDSILEISKSFNLEGDISPFENTGVFIEGKYTSFKSFPAYDGQYILLKDILEEEVEAEFYLSNSDLDKWKYLKGGKSESRTTKSGFTYKFSEGGMVFPDDLNKPSRTIITSEGGSFPSRFKHVVSTKKGLRRLTPIELERLNGFPDDHSKLDGISNAKRAFFMGNALVVGIIEKIAEEFRLRKS